MSATEPVSPPAPDDLDELIAERTRANPKFPKMLRAASVRRAKRVSDSRSATRPQRDS